MQQPASTASIGDLSVCQWLALHARQRPLATAIAQGVHRTTYRTLAIQVVQVIHALTEAGIRRGQVVGIEAYDRHLHLLIVVACMAMDVTTMSLTPSELVAPLDLGRLCDRVVVSQSFPGVDLTRVLIMTRDWLGRVRAPAVGDPSLDDPSLDALDRQPRANSVARFVKSSGTTGVPKVMDMTHGTQQRLVQKCLSLAAPWILPHPDFLCLYHFSVRACLNRAFATLQLGGTIHIADVAAIWDLIATKTVNYAVFLAGDLERFVTSVPPNHGPFDLYIDVSGGAVSSPLRQQIKDRLTPHLCVTYACNEVYNIAHIDEDNIGTICPDVSVMIVDDGGNPVPMGAQGMIRVKTDTMATGYINAPALTRAVFVDGWFLTNDVGFQPAPDKLVLLGRADDLLNIGGIKIAPRPIEERLKMIDGVSDAVVMSVADDSAADTLLVALETGSEGCSRQLEQLTMPIIRSYLTHYKLIGLPVFPRTDTGKIRRTGIRQAYRQTSSAT
jgi:acyl-CoA synthetase (AMP-forming)/AMP-acid ligase II